MNTSNAEGASQHTSNLQVINGLPFSLIFKRETIEEVLNFKSQEGDIIIATYPKTGTTWVQYIVLQIFSKGEFFPEFNDLLDKYAPFIDMIGVSAVEAIKTKPRFYKTHLPYNMINLHPGSKIIYVYRKPDDSFVSFYNYMNSMVGSLDFDQYFEDYMSGNVTYGSYFEHVLSYVNKMGEGNILIVSYEKLHASITSEILRIAKFLGQDYHQTILNDESILNKIIKHTSFDYMQKNLSLRRPENPVKDHFSKDVPQKNIIFFRKGKVGDGENNLSEDQLKRLRTLAEEKLKGTHIIKEWYQN